MASFPCSIHNCYHDILVDIFDHAKEEDIYIGREYPKSVLSDNNHEHKSSLDSGIELRISGQHVTCISMGLCVSCLSLNCCNCSSPTITNNLISVHYIWFII